MTSRTKLWALSAGALALSLALAGCGGGGSGTSSGMMPPGGGGGGMPEAISLDGLAGAMVPEGEYEIAAGETEVAGDVMFACPAGGADCTVTVDADGTATPAGGTATAARSAAYIAAATEAADTKATAIAAEGRQGMTDEPVDAGLGGSGTPDTSVDQAAGEYNLAIRHGTTSITVEAADADDDVTFTEAMDFGDGRTMHVLANEADEETGNVVEEVVIVYTDIEVPEATAFADVHMLDANQNTENPPVAQSLAIVDSNLAMVSGVSEFPSAPRQTNVPFDDEAEFEGMFNGAPGTYTCASTGCQLSTDEDGELNNIGGTWHFTPDDDAMVDVVDADYLHYGFWLRRTTDEDGVLTYNEVETFAGSSIAATGSVAGVKGTATYDGGAVGVYVINNEYDVDTGDVVDATSGHFHCGCQPGGEFRAGAGCR